MFWSAREGTEKKLQLVEGSKLDPKARKDKKPELEEVCRQQEGRQ